MLKSRKKIFQLMVADKNQKYFEISNHVKGDNLAPTLFDRQKYDLSIVELFLLAVSVYLNTLT